MKGLVYVIIFGNVIAGRFATDWKAAAFSYVTAVVLSLTSIELAIRDQTDAMEDDDE